MQPYFDVLKDPYSIPSELMRNIQVAIKIDGVKQLGVGGRVVGVTSSIAGEGKSTVSTLMAAYLASTRARVVLMDCDFRRATLTGQLCPDLAATAALSLNSSPEGDETRPSPESFLLRVNDYLQVLPVTGFGADHRELYELLQGRVAALIAQLRSRYDYIVVDLPPVLQAPDARALADVIDNLVFVVEWAALEKRTLEKSMVVAPELTSKIVGTVLNKVPEKKIKRDAPHSIYYGPTWESTQLRRA